MKKKIFVTVLVAVMALSMLSACGENGGGGNGGGSSDVYESKLYPTPDGVSFKASQKNKSAPDWKEYDSLIEEIQTTTDMTERIAKMHKAEDILMGTGAIIPIYYYNDLYMQKSDVTGIYANLFGFKWFQFASCPRDVLKVNLASEPAKIDPALNSSVDGACMCVNLFAGLYTYDAEGNLQPDLADHSNPYTLSDDGLTYTFTLQGGLKWSDGTPVTTADFVYSWNRVAADLTAADYQYMFDIIARNDDGTLNVKADGNKLTVVLKAPCAYFLDLCAFPAYLPVPQAQVEAASDWQTNPGSWAAEAGFVTNGAYTVSEWKHNESMVLTKNPNYYRTVPTNEVPNLKNDPEFHVIDNLGTYYAAFNVNSKLFEGKTVEQAIAMRKAFSLLIDRNYIIDTVGQTGQKIATSFVPEGMADGQGGIFKKNTDKYTFPDKDSIGYYPSEKSDECVEEARKLLESAGYKFTADGLLDSSTPINVTYLTNDGTGHIAIAESMQQDLGEVGIKMTIDTREWNVFLDERKQGHFDFAREGWLADFNDPINMLEMWATESGNNDCQFGR